MASTLVDLLTLGLLVGGGYWLYTSGTLNQLMGTPLPVAANTLPSQAEPMLPTEEDIPSQQGSYYPPEQPPYMMPPQQPQYQMPQMPQYIQTPNPPPPGTTSSLVPIPVDPNQPPPYISQTVGTYSPYSPYNQFDVYKQYQTPAQGRLAPMLDDNVGFTDIDTSRFGCSSCKSVCRHRGPGSFSCMTCRPSCKKINHYFTPPQQGWTIGPVGQVSPYSYTQVPPGAAYSPYQSYLGQVWNMLTGTGGGHGATFMDTEDYHKDRRFDCHNKLRRRAHGKDNSFVSQEDYYYDRNDIKLANL